MRRATAFLLGFFVLTCSSLSGAEETSPKTGPTAPLSGSSRKKAAEGRQPPAEVIQNLELLQNLPLLKEIDLYEQMPPNGINRKKCADPSLACSKGRSSTETNRKEEIAQ
jgi:hypothetical protein